jgi:hypothetical protein
VKPRIETPPSSAKFAMSIEAGASGSLKDTVTFDPLKVAAAERTAGGVRSPLVRTSTCSDLTV